MLLFKSSPEEIYRKRDMSLTIYVNDDNGDELFDLIFQYVESDDSNELYRVHSSFNDEDIPVNSENDLNEILFNLISNIVDENGIKEDVQQIVDNVIEEISDMDFN